MNFKPAGGGAEARRQAGGEETRRKKSISRRVSSVRRRVPSLTRCARYTRCPVIISSRSLHVPGTRRPIFPAEERSRRRRFLRPRRAAERRTGSQPVFFQSERSSGETFARLEHQVGSGRHAVRVWRREGTVRSRLLTLCGSRHLSAPRSEASIDFYSVQLHSAPRLCV